jgi:hypothetical protein|uniref:Uncharacterized protein n=1 Tax=Podoviridae sp. ctQyH19 TaxID=2825249 RepID=A0A8S5UQQ7_9CAUD|nr:MAG TPA: hypothetical protein [Podoviridae sp. ctQyH19]
METIVKLAVYGGLVYSIAVVMKSSIKELRVQAKKNKIF